MKKNLIIFTIAMASSMLLMAQGKVNTKPDELKTVTIGTQQWTSSNIAISKYLNGDIIPQAKNMEEWIKYGTDKKGAWCYYDFDEKNGTLYGKLYNWFAINDSRGFAPSGYHVPSDKEWRTLSDFLGGYEGAGKKLKSKEGWKDNGNGTDENGFKALPGGGVWEKGFYSLGEYGNWWSSTENDEELAYHRDMGYNSNSLYRGYAGKTKTRGFSVRLIKD